MTKPQTSFWILAACVLVAGCAVREAKPIAFADYDRETDFSGYRSYAWMSVNPLYVATIQPVNPSLQKYLMDETSAQLTALGMRKVARPEDADFVVAFSVGTRDDLQINNYPAKYRQFATGSIGYRARSEVREVTTGAITIDVFNQASGQRTWTGWATTGLTMDVRANSEPIVREMVRLILEVFPPAS